MTDDKKGRDLEWGFSVIAFSIAIMICFAVGSRTYFPLNLVLYIVGVELIIVWGDLHARFKKYQ